jgi:hypothetical protein
MAVRLSALSAGSPPFAPHEDELLFSLSTAIYSISQMYALFYGEIIFYIFENPRRFVLSGRQTLWYSAFFTGCWSQFFFRASVLVVELKILDSLPISSLLTVKV